MKTKPLTDREIRTIFFNIVFVLVIPTTAVLMVAHWNLQDQVHSLRAEIEKLKAELAEAK